MQSVKYRERRGATRCSDPAGTGSLPLVEGHVPVGAIRKLLAERPSIKGISLPGMPEARRA
jgi:hypothetical protein